jgi:hypothetical protein
MQLDNSNGINRIATDPNLSTQEKNWELMSVLGMKWSETVSLSDEDRDFLLTKVEKIKIHIEKSSKIQ